MTYQLVIGREFSLSTTTSTKSGFTKPSSSYSTYFQPSCFPKICKEIKTFVSLRYPVIGRNPLFFFFLENGTNKFFFFFRVFLILIEGVPNFFF